MTLFLKNDTCFPQINIIYKDASYLLKKDEIIELFVDSLKIELYVLVPEENTVTFNWLFALIDGFVSEENVICCFNCNLKVALCLTENTSEVVFKNIEARDDKNGYIYNSLFVLPRELNVNIMKYQLINTERSRRKALFYLIFLTSLLPFLIVLLIKFLSSGNVYAIIAFLVILILFSIPNWRKANRTKLYFNDVKATEMLVNEYKRLELNNWNTNIEPEGSIDKAMFKILDFIFGKKRNK